MNGGFDRVAVCGGVEVVYREGLDGGGTTWGQDIVQAVQRTTGPVDSVLDWCSGPGFLGFALLGTGMCRSLALADINPDAIEAASRTVLRNGLEDRVQVYLSDGLDGVTAAAPFDLVVGNPPHSPTGVPAEGRGTPLVYMDPGWALHRRFFQDVREFVRPGGSILLMENGKDSSPDDFAEFFMASGFRLRSSFPCDAHPGGTVYYLWVGDAP